MKDDNSCKKQMIYGSKGRPRASLKDKSEKEQMKCDEAGLTTGASCILYNVPLEGHLNINNSACSTKLRLDLDDCFHLHCHIKW